GHEQDAARQGRRGEPRPVPHVLDLRARPELADEQHRRDEEREQRRNGAPARAGQGHGAGRCERGCHHAEALDRRGYRERSDHSARVAFEISGSPCSCAPHCGTPTRTTVPLPSRYATTAGWRGSRPAPTSTRVPGGTACDCSNRLNSPTKPSLPPNSPIVSEFTTSGAGAEAVAAVRSPKAFAFLGGPARLRVEVPICTA